MKPWREGNSHLIIYKMVNYQVKVRADKNEEVVVEEEVKEEEDGQEGDNDEQEMKNMEVIW